MNDIHEHLVESRIAKHKCVALCTEVVLPLERVKNIVNLFGNIRNGNKNSTLQ